MTQRTKLELELNKPTEIELLYDECVSGNSQYGDYYLYAVKSDGKEWSFFPNEQVHFQLKTLRRGDKAVITKLASQRGNKIVTTFDVQVNNKVSVSAAAEPEYINDTNEDKYTDRYYEVILQSYRDALKIQGKLNGLVDVNKIAITLFIARSK
ncbi:MAG: hypothetical protein KJ571_11595 [Bacteroidetes bacterium]|nr:hypothetical protein [Bacteroidota bacterium]